MSPPMLVGQNLQQNLKEKGSTAKSAILSEIVNLSFKKKRKYTDVVRANLERVLLKMAENSMRLFLLQQGNFHISIPDDDWKSYQEDDERWLEYELKKAHKSWSFRQSSWWTAMKDIVGKFSAAGNQYVPCSFSN